MEVLWTGQDAKEEFGVVRVPPGHVSRVKRSPSRRFVISNLQDWVDHSGFLSSSASSVPEEGASFSSLVANFRLDRYQPLKEVYRYLKEVSGRRQGVTLFDLGTTHEGRKIKAIEIIGNPADKRFVWIDGCTHAREWITVATALYFVEQTLLSRIAINVVIVPVLNPDGYEYTWSTDRLWRKNRRPFSGDRQARAMSMDSNEDSCNGVDLNRNYDLNFGGSGSSGSACSHLYQGPQALSEPETQAVANMLWAIKGQVSMFLSLHSFNQLWACPFAYTKTPTAHQAMHMDVLRAIQDAVYQTNGVNYKIGPLSTSLYVGSGFALDWAYTNARIVHSYLVELRDEGVYGFLLPADQILPTATETWNGFRAAIHKIYGELST